MQHDILQICINCIKKLIGVSNVFGLTVKIESDNKKLELILEKNNNNKGNSKKGNELLWQY